MIRIRKEQTDDLPLVHKLNALAFETAAEADLVDVLRAKAQPVVSLVAVDDHAIVGHIMFTPVALYGKPSLKIMALAPMAVTPDRQRCGIGSALVSEGIDRCAKIGAGAMVVLGHPAYYPRFGFAPASTMKIKCAYDVPDEAFMILELTADYLARAAGTIKYHQAFADVS